MLLSARWARSRSAPGVLVVGTTHLVRAGLWLVVALGALAGLYLVLAAELVAWVQVLIYVGAVVVLLLFAVMLTRAPIGASTDLDRPGWPARWSARGAGAGPGRPAGRRVPLDVRGEAAVGERRERRRAVFRSWVLPFEVLSVLLLAALVGAIVLSKSGAVPKPSDAGTR